MFTRLVKYAGFLSVALLVGAVSVVASGITLKTGGSVVQKTGGSMTFVAPGSRIGYNEQIFLASYLTSYSQMQRTGSSWLRWEDDWASVQATSSASFVWGPMDTKINAAIADGINSLLIIHYAPTWESSRNCGVNGCVPASTSDFATFCGASATHFLGRVHAYEVWNEENIGQWGLYGIVDYVSYLNACHDAIKLVDPTAVVMNGGLAPAATSAGVSESPMAAIADFYTGGAEYDDLAFHPYSYPASLSIGDSSNNGGLM